MSGRILAATAARRARGLRPSAPTTIDPETWNADLATYYATIVPSDASADRFVDFGAGSDANAGTSWATAYATMAKAAADLDGVGGIVKVQGTATAGVSAITSDGASTASRIEFWADGLYGAKIDANGSYYGMQLNCDYVEVNGFEVYDAEAVGIRIYKTGDYQTTGAFHNRVRFCYVHDLRWTTSNSGNGGAYIAAQGPYSEVDSCFAYGGTPGGGDSFSTLMQGIYGRGSWIKLTNNLVVSIRAGRGIQFYYSDTSKVIDCEVRNNTVLRCSDGGIQIQAQNALVANNIIAHNDGPGIRVFGTNSYGTFTHNLFYDNPAQLSDFSVNYTNTNDNAVLGEPGFVDYRADGTGDYRVTAPSPAYQAANATHAPALDRFGNARTATPTIGCHEVQP